jgi:chromosome segregation ATPase
MSDFTSSWEEYRLLVIKELEELNLKADGLETKFNTLNTELALVKQNAGKIDTLLDKMAEVSSEITRLREGIEGAENKLKTHETWHETERTTKQAQQSKIKDRHWSLFLALIAVIAAIVAALI